MTIPTINTELMLLSWRESSSGGASVTFALPDAESLEQFKALTAAKGGKGGQRFMAAFALLNDDETPAELPARTPARTSGEVTPAHTPAQESKGPLGPRAWLAVQLCSNPSFSEWLRPRYDRMLSGNGNSWGDVTPEDFTDKTEAKCLEAWTKHAILVFCRCDESRRELDDKPECGRLFETWIRRPWVESQEVTA